MNKDIHFELKLGTQLNDNSNIYEGLKFPIILIGFDKEYISAQIDARLQYNLPVIIVHPAINKEIDITNLFIDNKAIMLDFKSRMEEMIIELEKQTKELKYIPEKSDEFIRFEKEQNRLRQKYHSRNFKKK